MKLPVFSLTRARSLEQALTLLDELGADAKPLAGGQSLTPLMSFRLAAPAHLVDVSELDELRYIRAGADGLVVGAMTRHAELEAALPDLPAHWAAFSDALPLLGHLPIRTRGTIGGSLAHADATAQLPLLARTFDAVIVARSREGAREIAAADFFHGTMTTDLAPGELVVEVRFPSPPPDAASAFEEFSERAGDFALASACAAVACDERGDCTWARVGLGAVAAVPVRSPEAEAALVGSPLDQRAIDAAAAAAAAAVRPRAGLRVSAESRTELAVATLTRALRRAAGRSGIPVRP